MEEIESYWEVPTITHFCHIFRAAFNLFHFEIEELEQAICQKGSDPESYFSIDLLMTRLLEGCFDSEKGITIDNWEQHLVQLFESNFDNGDNPIGDNRTPFAFLTAYEKVKIIFKLCELRLNAKDVSETIKDISAESMQAKLVGKDSKNCFYWYFCGVRLFKEDKTKSKQDLIKNELTLQDLKKETLKQKKGTATNNINARHPREERRKSKIKIENSWSVVCRTISDWELLAKSFSKSKNIHEKELSEEIASNYLPTLTIIIAEAERLTRKRLLELAPKRTSSRISKLVEQKKEEDEIATKTAEEEKKQREQRQIEEEKQRKKHEKEERSKRIAERNKAMEERTKRANQRQKRLYDTRETISRNSKTPKKDEVFNQIDIATSVKRSSLKFLKNRSSKSPKNFISKPLNNSSKSPKNSNLKSPKNSNLKCPKNFSSKFLENDSPKNSKNFSPKSSQIISPKSPKNLISKSPQIKSVKNFSPKDTLTFSSRILRNKKEMCSPIKSENRSNLRAKSYQNCSDEKESSSSEAMPADENKVCDRSESNSETSDNDNFSSNEKDSYNDTESSSRKKSVSKNKSTRGSSEHFIVKRMIPSHYNRKDVVRHSQSVHQFNSSANTKGKSLHIVNKSPKDQSTTSKVFRRSENHYYRSRKYEGYRVYKPKIVLQPITVPIKNICSYNKSTTTPAIIRFDFIKKNTNL